MLNRRAIFRMALLPIAGLGNLWAAAATADLNSIPAVDQGVIGSFMKAIRADSTPAMEAFVDRYVSPRPEISRAACLHALRDISAEAQGLTLLAARAGPGIQLLVRTRSGRVAQIEFDRDPGDAGRVMAISTMPLPTKYPHAGLAGSVSREVLLRDIERRVRFAAERHDFSGTVRVFQGQDTVFEGAYGKSNQHRDLPNTLSTRFNFGSVGKMFTSVCIAQLVERGRVSLDTRLIEVLRDYPNRSAARKISIRNLLTHSAGLGSLFDRPGFSDRLHFSSMTELLSVFAAAPLAFEPGTATAYSNEGFLVLGAVIERISGLNWYQYVSQHVLARASMKDTVFPTVAEVRESPATYAVGYTWGESDPLGVRGRRANWSKMLGWRGQSSGGGYSTVADLSAFMVALRDGTLVNSSLADLFTAPVHVGPRGAELGPPDVGMDFTCRVGPHHHTLRGHQGGAPGANADVEIVWETGYGYAILSNFDPPVADVIGRDLGAMLLWQTS